MIQVLSELKDSIEINIESASILSDVQEMSTSSNTSHSRRRKRPGAKERTKGTNDKLSKLENLKMLYEEGYLKKEEYMQRRSQIIDEMTGTSSTGGIGESGTQVMTSLLTHSS